MQVTSLGVDGNPTAKFEQIGTEVKGRIVALAEVQQKVYQKEELAFWPDGSPKMSVVVTLEQTPGDEDSRVKLFISSKRMKKEARRAFIEAGRNDLVLGDDMKITFTGYEGAAKVYAIKYVANDDEG